VSLDVAPAEGNGLVLTKDDRLEAMRWAIAQCDTWSELNEIRAGAPWRALTKFPGPIAERAARLMATRWQQIAARDSAADAARRNPVAQSKA
jgi:hypothetical protein